MAKLINQRLAQSLGGMLVFGFLSSQTLGGNNAKNIFYRVVADRTLFHLWDVL